MPDLIIRKVDKGFNSTVEDAVELMRGSAADGSQNVMYENGTIKTPRGFALVGSGDLPLDSGNPVLAQFMYAELDKTEHWLVATSDTIQERDNRGDGWTDLTQAGATFGANQYHPVSFAAMFHTDGLALNGSGDSSYHHVVACNGGLKAIQRWAGKYETDFADLLGGDGYHDTASGRTTHYALQVGAYKSHFLLISPREANANNHLIDNNQRIRWGVTGKLETWTGDYSGYKDLIDTGGYNVWSALLREQYVCYQNNSIWSLNHVGGTDVFDPLIEIPSLGLLGAHLLCSKNNIHYFVGNDYNVYAYFGGSEYKMIGNKIQRFLERDLLASYAYRSWICVGPKNKRLWIFIVPTGKTYCTEAYIIDIRSGAWMKREFTHKFTTGGISSVYLVGASDYEAGDSYQAKLLEESPPKVVAIGGAARVTTTVTITTSTEHSMLANETVTIAGCGAPFDGDHTIATIPVSPTGANGSPTTLTYTVADSGDMSNATAGTAKVDFLADGTTIKAPTSLDYIISGVTSMEALQTTLVDEELAIGDSAGNVYQFDSDLTQDGGVNIPALHITEIYDGGFPYRNKIWPAFTVVAKGTSITVSYRTGNFETTGTGWTAFDAQTLTSEFVAYNFYVNDTSLKVQFKFSGSSDFVVSEYGLHEPAVLERV